MRQFNIESRESVSGSGRAELEKNNEAFFKVKSEAGWGSEDVGHSWHGKVVRAKALRQKRTWLPRTEEVVMTAKQEAKGSVVGGETRERKRRGKP